MNTKRTIMVGGAVALALLALWAPRVCRAASLWNPVPREDLRPLSTDRPDMTESPFTVDAGHIQVEIDLASYARTNAFSEEVLRAGHLNLKIGLFDRVDAQFVLRSYTAVRTSISQKYIPVHENPTLRLKVNVTDGLSVPFDAALLPFVTLPVTNDPQVPNAVEYGLAVPFAFRLPGEFGAGAMAQVRTREDDHGYLLTLTAGHSIAGPLSGFVEYASEWVRVVDPYGFASSFSVASVNAGITVAIKSDVQWDAAVMADTSDEGPDWVVFTGLTVRR